MIRIATLRGPVTEAMRAPFAGVSLTVRRLTTPDFVRCQAAAWSIIRDREALPIVLERHSLVRTAGDMKRAMSDVAFQGGIGAWLASVECGLAAISDWEGLVGDDGETKAPLAAELVKVAGVVQPVEAADLAARITMETLMLDVAFERQARAMIDKAAVLLAVEGNG